MKAFAALGHVWRGEPCIEYPGTWLAYVEGKETRCSSWNEAFAVLGEAEYGEKASICWQCSDDDPRIGQVWFTGFYQHGKLDCWGNYVQ